MDVEWKARDSLFAQRLFRHYEVKCKNKRFVLWELETPPEGWSPATRDHEYVGPTIDLNVRSSESISKALEGPGKAYVAEHVTRARLELWRQAALQSTDETLIEDLMNDFLEAETAMAFNWPAFECDFLISEETKSRMGF